MLKIGHSDELQSLRGVAAVCVLLHHALRVLGPVGVTGWVADVLLNAHAAVVVFFVLSGFVLGRSILKRGTSRSALVDYSVRRIFRIYPALWVACTLGLVYFLVLRGVPAPHWAAWAARHYDPQMAGATTVIGSYLALSPFLDPPLWTILVELVASALLPGLVLLFSRAPRLTIPTILLLALVSFSEAHSLHGVLTYLVDFAFGAALAVGERRRLPGKWTTYVALALLLFFRQLHPWTYDAAVPGLVEGVAATIVIAAIADGGLGIMSHRWLVGLGNISYSLYLLHLPIAYSIARLLDRYVLGGSLTDVGPLIVAAGTLAVTLPLSALSYRFVERPGIELGRRLLRRRDARRPDVAVI